MERFPAAAVDLIYRASALVPADDSSFVNAKAFDPGMTEEFNKLPLEQRLRRLQEFRRANYTCVAPEARIMFPLARVNLTGIAAY